MKTKLKLSLVISILILSACGSADVSEEHDLEALQKTFANQIASNQQPFEFYFEKYFKVDNNQLQETSPGTISFPDQNEVEVFYEVSEAQVLKTGVLEYENQLLAENCNDNCPSIVNSEEIVVSQDLPAYKFLVNTNSSTENGTKRLHCSLVNQGKIYRFWTNEFQDNQEVFENKLDSIITNLSLK